MTSFLRVLECPTFRGNSEMAHERIRDDPFPICEWHPIIFPGSTRAHVAVIADVR
jgi:hypothetical protein